MDKPGHYLLLMLALPMTSPVSASPAAASATESELADFVAYEKQLQNHVDGFVKLRRQVRFFPVLALVTAPLGLFFATWVPFAIVALWLIFWSATLYITWMRTWQYKGELKRIRSEVARLQSALR